MVTSAALPTAPVSPRPGRAGLLAALGGLGLAIAVALLLERVDDSLRTKAQLERAAGLPVIGTIPTVSASLASLGRPSVVSLTTPRSPATEAYRTLRTAVQFLPIEGVTMIQVTSPTAGDGKTTTLANLGVALARAGQQVALVCCDLRRPKLHEFFGMTNDIGFTSVLLGKVPLSAALQQVPDQDRLYVLASGPLPPNPSELLSSRRAREVLASLRAEAEIVLIDSPPVLPVSDAMIIAGLVDITLLVCAADRTSTRDVTRAVEQLRQVEAPLGRRHPQRGRSRVVLRRQVRLRPPGAPRRRLRRGALEVDARQGGEVRIRTGEIRVVEIGAVEVDRRPLEGPPGGSAAPPVRAGNFPRDRGPGHGRQAPFLAERPPTGTRPGGRGGGGGGCRGRSGPTATPGRGRTSRGRPGG